MNAYSRAGWKDRSHAGTADAWSDVDLHVAVSDANWAAFRDRARDTLKRIGDVLAYGEMSFRGVRSISGDAEWPARLDLYIEREAGLARDCGLRSASPAVRSGRAGGICLRSRARSSR